MSFPLHKLISVRQLRLQSAQRELVSKQALMDAAQAELDNNASSTKLTESARRQAQDRTLKVIVDPQTSAGQTAARLELRIAWYGDELIRLGEQRDALLIKRSEAEQALTEARQIVRHMQAKCDALEQQRQHWHRAQQQREAVLDDDAAEERFTLASRAK